MLLTNVPMDHPVFSTGRWHDARWIHRAVMDLFGDLGNTSEARAAAGVLFRVEPHVDNGRVLVQSNVPPVVDGIRTRSLEPVRERLTGGRHVRFLLAANTVRTINRTGPGGSIRTHRARVFDDQLDGWLKQRLDGAVDVGPLAPPETRKLRQGPAQLIVTTFRGRGTVADPDRLTQLMSDGVGRAKAYGCGLLSVLPV